MNWTWDIRSRDGAMNGLEFARCTTAGDMARVLVHAAPGQMSIEVRAASGELVAEGDLDRVGDYSPMSLVQIGAGSMSRSEIWPSEEHHGLPVLLAGGEVGTLRQWHNSADRSWWRWSIEFSNHTGRPADWAPPGADAAAQPVPGVPFEPPPG